LQTWFKFVHLLHASTESDFDMAGLSNVCFWQKADINGSERWVILIAPSVRERRPGLMC
jgi:hypothetical protein